MTKFDFIPVLVSIVFVRPACLSGKPLRGG